MSTYLLNGGTYEVEGPISGTEQVFFQPIWLTFPTVIGPGNVYDSTTVTINGQWNRFTYSFDEAGGPGGGWFSNSGGGGSTDVPPPFSIPITDTQRMFVINIDDELGVFINPAPLSWTPGIVVAELDLPDGLTLVSTPLPTSFWLLGAALILLVMGTRPRSSYRRLQL